MDKIIRRIACAVSLSLCLLQATAHPASNKIFNKNGLGNFKIGMSLDDINQQLRHKIVLTPVDLRPTENCDYTNLQDLPGVAMLFVDERLLRIDVESKKIVYHGYIVVGMPKTVVAKKLRAFKEEAQDYIPDGVSFVVEDSTGPNAISFQFDDNKLSRMIIGNKTAIRYAEACL